MSDLPEYYFRVRENGAAVFRIDAENRHSRIEMEEIAALNIKNGNIKPHGDYQLTQTDMAEITAWMEARRAALAARDLDDLHRAVDYLNLTAHWVTSRASDEALEEITDKLLLAMHDLRSVLVRKKSERLSKSSKQGSEDHSGA